MSRRRNFVVTMFALAMWVTAAGGAPADDPPEMDPASFEQLDPATGLSHNSVHAIIQDRFGFLWFGTPDGLNRYDGHDVVVFRHQPDDGTTISSNVVLSLLEDRAGTIWVGTSAGVDRFLVAEGRFVRYVLGDESGSDPRPSVLFETRDGTLLAAFDGIFRYDDSRDRFERLVVMPQGGADVRRDVGGIAEDSSGALWVFERQYPGSATIGRLELETGHLNRWPVEPATLTSSAFLIDRHDRFWIDQAGPLEIDAVGQRFRQARPARGSAAWAIRELRNGDVWLGSAGEGLTRFRVGAGDGETHALGENPGYLENFVRAFCEDRAGTLWVGTHGGVYRLDPHRKPFSRVRHDPRKLASLSHDAVSAIAQDRDGDLWVGTYGGGLNRYNPRTGTTARVRGIVDPVILSLAVGHGDRIWVGHTGGLHSYDARRDTLTAHPLPVMPGTNDGQAINAIAIDGSGVLWLASGYGLYRYDPGTGTTTTFPVASDDSGPSAPYLQGLLLDGTDGLWMGSDGVMLDRLDFATGRFEHYPLQDDHGRSLSSEGIWQILDSRAGDLWLATGSGLLRFDRRRRAFERYSDRDGLPGTIVYAMAFDGDDHLWLGTNQGLSRFTPTGGADTRFWNFDRGDGLESTEFNRRAVLRTDAGELYFGSMEGLIHFDPRRIRHNTVPPPVVLTRVQRIGAEGAWAPDPDGLDAWDLSYRDTWFSIDFAALNFTNPGKNRYRYRLEGFDRDWSAPGTGRSARYTNVPPGRYRFRAIASNNDGVWSNEGASLDVRIAAPYWHAWWFRGLLAVAIGALLLAAHRYRIAQATALQELRLGIANDLHDDLSTDLSGVAIWAEMMARRFHGSDRDRSEFDQVHRTAVRMLDGLRDCVWYVNPEHDSLAATVHRMRDVVSRLSGDIVCRFTAPPADHLTSMNMSVRRNLFLIFKEALHNAVRHARARHIDISVDVQDGRFGLSVADDGVGFDLATASLGSGLDSMRRRAGQIGADLSITSTPGTGTAVTVSTALTS